MPVCVVSGDHGVRMELHRLLSAEGIGTAVFETAASFVVCPQPDTPSCVILDVVPDTNGLDLQQFVEMGPPVLLLMGHEDLASSVRAIKAGVYDLLTLPLEPQHLIIAVRSAIEYDASTRAARQRIMGMRRRLEQLTNRERQVMMLTIGGAFNKQVAAVLGICEATVQSHRRRVMQKMDATCLADLVRCAELRGVQPDSRALAYRSHTGRRE
ncbi:response regulator transcription factor [Povalibacter sp.]|uniref:response regulator transcription factor n=1 Tax=Povalibacter sp. TaxID=1962978 RepID=UPI002F4012B4